MSNTTKTQHFFHDYACRFNDIYANSNGPINRHINTWFRKAMKLRYVQTLQGCDPLQGHTVLDVGCGPGHYSIELARRGATAVKGIDFAPNMISLALQHAADAGVSDRCHFDVASFMDFNPSQSFDYVIVMGFMDYVHDAPPVIRRAVGLCSRRAFFSFPLDGGFLGWQRKLRYRNRCPLFMYTRAQVDSLFALGDAFRVDVITLDRDVFVTVERT